MEVREVMAKCAICDKNINFGNQLSITRWLELIISLLPLIDKMYMFSDLKG